MMMRTLLTPFKRALRSLMRPTSRAQSGQALVVLAVGFVGLLGFVGIVTDVSLLFIRYSTMRRAVDAASVAAAGQMRRVIDETPSDGVAQGEADSVANLNLAARQFIELYGLNPSSVLVETCRAQQVARDGAGNPLDGAGVALFLSSGAVNPAADPAVVASYQQLCTERELKLVRVTAQIEAPTVFMRLLGYDTITLTESSISQTAVIDVVLVLDVSESMLNETDYADWDTLSPPMGVRYWPPYVDNSYFDVKNYSDPMITDRDTLSAILTNSQRNINNAIDPADPDNPSFSVLQYQMTDQLGRYEPLGGGAWQTYTTAGASPTGRVEPREFCRVRAYMNGAVGPAVPQWLRQEYAGIASSLGFNYALQWEQDDSLDPNETLDTMGIPIATYLPNGTPINADITGNVSRNFRMFVPQYNYFGCCNDPDGNLDAFGNFDMSDLVCQPFRQARDAAEEFLARLDFLRGDRVGFVTFDRQASLVTAIVRNGSGQNIQGAMFESEFNLVDSGGTLLRIGATDYLRRAIGVRTESSTYADLNGPSGQPDGFWDRIIEGSGGTPYETYDSLMDTPIGNFINNPVAGACPYDKAFAGAQFSTADTMPDGSVRPLDSALLDSIHSVPSWYALGGDLKARSYEYRASCRGTNIGGALAQGSATLFNNGRQEGSVWIMVMLSDGAANGSNQVHRQASVIPSEAQPYHLTSGNHQPLNAIGGTTPLSAVPQPAEAYGAFGLCPYGSSTQYGELLLDTFPPYCQDIRPETRNYCSTVVRNPSRVNDYPLDSYPNCFEFYDVDDYARDWADWIALGDLPGAVTGSGTGRASDLLLPTIFTIGFGLDFGDTACGATDYDCQRAFVGGSSIGRPSQADMPRREDYLGEELLRYIADAGDNGQIDSDYWQLSLGARIGNDPITGEWGPRGACEQATIIAPRGTVYQPLPPREDCGNYFNADSEGELVIVFNEIASRMFTRLSR